jgi:hypothetical protein
MRRVNPSAEAHVRCGYTPNELAPLLRVSPDKVRRWIEAGELLAINTAAAKCGKPRYVVLPEHLRAFARRRSAAQPKVQPRRKRRTVRDYYPD